MPVSCAYPGCFNIKRPKRTFSSGQTFLTFHRFPTHNPERLILWLLALHLDINTPEHALICKRVCSDHFFEDDFKPSQQGQRRYLKASAVPNTYLQQTEYPSHGNLECPATDSSAELEVQEAVGLEFLANVPQSTPVKQQDSDPGTTTRQFADTQSKLRLLLTSPESVRNRKTPSSSGIYFAQPAIHSNQTPPVYNQPEQMEEQLEESLALDVSLLSIEPQSDKKDLSFQPLSSTSTSTTNSAEEECELHWKQKKWIVNEPNVMELFKRCQECGSVITNTAKATVGSVLRVHWECEKKHKGKWSSCSDVRGMPANNLLVSACTLFTGATYTDIADWATLLNLQIPHKTTYFDIQSSYLTPVIDEEYKEQQKAAMNDLHLQSELCNPVHLSGDGRSDSPGFSAKYNTYSFMDDTTDKIVHFELVQQSFPTTRETEFQCDNMQKVTREVGCQTDYFVGKRTVATQLSKRTLANRKNTGSQATVATKSVSVGNTTAKLLPLCSSTPLKRKAVSPDRPPKRSLLEFPSFQESVNSFNMADPDDSTYLPSMSELVDTTSEQAPTKPPQDMVKYLIYEECLLELFKICPTCSRVCKVIKFVKGTFLSVTQKCLHQSCSYTREWKSQPLLGSSPAGNLHLSAAVYYTGSSFIQTNKVLNAMHVRTFSRMTHRNHVHNYILPSVLHKWRSHQSDLLEGLKQSETVSLGGDMRADSPGHCAKYGSYSMMDLSTNKIVDIQLVQSNEVGSSVHMEKEGLIRSLEFLEKSGVKVASLVTDRHTQVQKFVREQKPDIDHFYDVWHLCKALTKKVDAMSKEKDCNTVKMWQKSIKNHLYWSASGSSNGEETVAKWTSLLNHVQNVHVHENPLFPKCLHPPSTDKNKWLKPATKAVYKLEKVLMNKRVLGDVKKLSPLYQTSALEGFHSVILRFAPKNVVFSYLGMLCRLYLAALHFNENSGRTQARTAAGELRFKIKFPKAKRGEHVVSMVKTKYSTEYVTELMDILFNEVIQDPAPFVANMKAVAVPGFLCSTYERPGKSDAIASHVSRFSCPSCEGTALTTPI